MALFYQFARNLVVPHNSLMNLRRFVCALVFLLCASFAQAADLVAERAWLEDPSGTMTLAEARQAPTTPLAGKLFTQGYSKSAYWIRLRIDPTHLALSASDKLVIRLRPPYQDQIWLFDPLVAQDTVRVTGDYYDWADDEYRSLNLNFVIPVGAQPRDIWLRLKATVSTLTFIEVMTEDEVRAADRRQEMIAMLYLSVLFICLGWAVLARINRKDTLLTGYIIRETFAIGYALAVLGYLRVFSSGWLVPYWVDAITNLLVFGFPAVAIWFDSKLIGEFKPNRWLARFHFGLVFFFPIEAVLALSGHMFWAGRLNAFVIVAAVILVVLCALSTRAWVQARHASSEAQPPYPKTLLVFVYGLVLVVVLLHRLPVMGSTVGQEYFVYFSLLFPLLTSVLLMGLVQVRLYRSAKKQAQEQRRAEIAEIDAQNERAHRIEQSNFLKMLAHEMKTPLSVVRMAVGVTPLPEKTHQAVDRAVTDMNGIIERLLQVERLHDEQIVINRENFDLFEILQSIIGALLQGERIHVSKHGSLIVDSDQQLVRVILSNLLDNALKYSPLGSQVQISVNGMSEAIRVFVENEVGSAGKPNPERAFEKYYRADRAHERTGSGLGLYLVKSLASLLGADVRYVPGEGIVRFELTLPR